jgi:hypothetical protein
MKARQAAASLRESFAIRQAIGPRLDGPYQLAVLSEVLARAGDTQALTTGRPTTFHFEAGPSQLAAQTLGL